MPSTEGFNQGRSGQLALDRRRTWTPSPVPELAAVVREREHQRPALDMVARVRLPILAIAGVDALALGLPVAGCSLRRTVAAAPAPPPPAGLCDSPPYRPARVHEEAMLGDERRIPAPERVFPCPGVYQARIVFGIARSRSRLRDNGSPVARE